jgi:hypothetical protein
MKRLMMAFPAIRYFFDVNLNNLRRGPRFINFMES